MDEDNLIPPTGWVICTLKDVAEWGSGGTPLSTNPMYYVGEIPWLVIGDLNDGLVNKSKNSITEKGLQNSSAKMVKPNSVLIAMYGSIGKLGINQIPLATNQAIAFTEELYKCINNKYLFYYLRSIRSYLLSLGKGAAQKNISQAVLKAISIPLPPLAEQERIVAKIEELFSSLDKGTESLKSAQAQLKLYRQAVLKQAFEGKLTNKNVKDGELPEGWVILSLSEISEIFIGSTPSRNVSSYWGGSINWVSSGEVAFHYIMETKETITYEGFNNSSCKLHKPGTVILAMIGEGKTRGQAAILKIPATHNQNTAAILSLIHI